MKCRVLWLVISVINYGSCAVEVITTCNCGEANVVNPSRIVNGRQTDPYKYPWMAGLISPKGHLMCAGSIISTKNILTAAHCFFYMSNPSQSQWVLGMHDRKTLIGERYRTFHHETHPKFSNNTFFDDFDIALATTERPIIFSFKVKPICLPTAGENFGGISASVAGWGRLDEAKGAALPDFLMETKVWIKTDSECMDLTYKMLSGAYNAESMVCAYELNTDACQGDSGGPLFVETLPNHFVIAGVVSFGSGCARSFPGIYGRIGTASTLRWIESYVQTASGAVCISDTGLQSRFMPEPITAPYRPHIRDERLRWVPINPYYVG